LDDADGGLRGPRARPGPGLFAALEDRYGLGRSAEAVDLGGSSSLNLLVGDGDRRYVVRVHRPHVTTERLGALHQVRQVLLAGAVPCATSITTRQGEPWVILAGRLVEVEAYVDHDAVMDAWERLEVGMALLARTHNLLRQVRVGEAGRRPRFANHIEPADVQAATRHGTRRIRGWGPTPGERRLAAAAEKLADLVAEAEAGLVARLPRQLVHGDFWDDNVLFRHGRPVLLADFDFLGERARIDDLALTLHCARIDLGAQAGGAAQERDRLGRLVAGYDAGLEVPLSDAERAALPVAMARQPLASVGGWVARLDDRAAARQHAAGVGGEVAAALRIMADLGRWRDAFASAGRSAAAIGERKFR
jgi:Ser/Thr protein kinase RdoA (MazF antagonist)